MRLDDLYKMTAYIYGDRNSTRNKEATFAHFVEVCGMLTLHDRGKKRESFDTTDALCKTLGWYFPLLAKMRIESVEALVFRKFPRVCPYCRKAPHDEAACKLVRGTLSTVNHEQVVQHFQSKFPDRPTSLNEWQAMFNDIYPRSVNDQGRSSIGLMEELGELAEAVRVFDSHPHYFLGEAADTFSYIMGMANEHTLREAREEREFNFQREYLQRYPGLCTQCGSRVCICPAIPAATVGRMAKELRLAEHDAPFVTDVEKFAMEGRDSALAALESMGGYAGLAEKLPFDRGDANQGLVKLSLKMAAAVEPANPEFAAGLRAEALKLGDLTREPGTLREAIPVQKLLDDLRALWREMDDESQQEIKGSGGMVTELAEILDHVRVLFVFSNPLGSGGELDLQSERRSISDALRRGKYSGKFSITELPAATKDDVRRALLEGEFDVVHFSCHADGEGLVLVDEQKNPVDVPLSAIEELIQAHPVTKCVVLNACEAANGLSRSLSPVTIAMDQSIPDESAIEFSRGFYDALAAGRSFKFAYEEGQRAVRMTGAPADYIKLITYVKENV